MPPRIDAVRYPAAVRELTACIGGPRGRFAVIRARSWWSPPQMIFTTTLVFLACGFLTKAQCIQGVAGNGGVVQLNWSGHRQFVSACYTDIVPLYAGDGGLSHYLNVPALSAPSTLPSRICRDRCCQSRGCFSS